MKQAHVRPQRRSEAESTTKRIQLLSLDSNIAELGLIEISIAAFKCQVPK